MDMHVWAGGELKGVGGWSCEAFLEEVTSGLRPRSGRGAAPRRSGEEWRWRSLVGNQLSLWEERKEACG